MGAGLDAVEQLAPGAGQFEVGLAAHLLPDPSLGAYLDYQHRITESMSVFTRAEGWYEQDFYARTLAGFRWRF